MKNATLILLALAITTLSACRVGTTPDLTCPTPPGQKQPAPTPPGTTTPYVMTGTVKTEAGEPLSGVEVFADPTAYYDMNAVCEPDAQGRSHIPLAQHPGTWNAGAYLKLTSGGETFEVHLSPDDDTPFDGSKGAVHNIHVQGQRRSHGQGEHVHRALQG